MLDLMMVLAIQTLPNVEFNPGTARREGFEYQQRLQDAAAARRNTSSASGERCAGRDWWMIECSASDHGAAVAAKALRDRVTGLLAENKCPEAVRAALEGGDMNLAREARDFCRP